MRDGKTSQPGRSPHSPACTRPLARALPILSGYYDPLRTAGLPKFKDLGREGPFLGSLADVAGNARQAVDDGTTAIAAGTDGGDSMALCACCLAV
jgi:hypothetical protein